MILSLFNKDIHEPQRYIWVYIYMLIEIEIQLIWTFFYD